MFSSTAHVRERGLDKKLSLALGHDRGVAVYWGEGHRLPQHLQLEVEPGVDRPRGEGDGQDSDVEVLLGLV